MSKELLSLADRIKTLRESVGLTQAEIARILGAYLAPVSTLGKWGYLFPPHNTSLNLPNNSMFRQITY